MLAAGFIVWKETLMRHRHTAMLTALLTAALTSLAAAQQTAPDSTHLQRDIPN